MQYPGAIYHVFDRGDRKEPIFLDPEDRTAFLRTLAETCERTGFLIHSHVLMKNHYHLLLETPEANLVAGMKWLQGTYTQRFNRRHQLVGHLYQGRYKAKPIEPDHPGYFRRVVEYIHLNPAQGGIPLGSPAQLQSYPWSSFRYFVQKNRSLHKWLTPAKAFSSFGLEDNHAGRQSFRDYLNVRAQEIVNGAIDPRMKLEIAAIEKGWCLGSESFSKWLMEQVDKVVTGHQRESYAGPELIYHDEQAAQRWLDSGLHAIALTLEQVRALRHNEPQKQCLAWWVKSQTVITDRWLVERLCMGHRSNISRAVAAFRNPVDLVRRTLKETLLTRASLSI